MADQESTRKTVSFTHRQLGWGVGGLASIAMIAQLKSVFLTREEGAAHSQQLIEVRLEIASLKVDMREQIEHATEKIVARIKESEDRSVKTAERIEGRVDTLELAQRANKTGRQNN